MGDQNPLIYNFDNHRNLSNANNQYDFQIHHIFYASALIWIPFALICL